MGGKEEVSRCKAKRAVKKRWGEESPINYQGTTDGQSYVCTPETLRQDTLQQKKYGEREKKLAHNVVQINAG